MSANKTLSSRPVASRDVVATRPVASRDAVASRDVAAFPPMPLTPEQMQMAAMYAQMMQMQEQMQMMQLNSQTQSERIPHKQARPARVLNAPKPVGRSGLASSRPQRTPRVAPTEDEIMRPYAFACHQLYVKLVRATDGAFYNMPEDATSNLVKGIRLDDVFKCANGDGKMSIISVADALYGFRERGGHYTQRRRTHASYHITNPFEAAQIYALSKGYYLANTSEVYHPSVARAEHPAPRCCSEC